MYAMCNELQKAPALLDMHINSNIVAWNALNASYVRKGKGRQAWDYFKQIQCEGIPPIEVTYECILKACVAMELWKGGTKSMADWMVGVAVEKPARVAWSYSRGEPA